jgi:pyridoxal phosphate enzyme (YggS family)
MNLAERYRSVLANIEQAAVTSGRSASDVELVIVTKNQPSELVLELVELGHRVFGENRDQEASKKAAEVSRSGDIANWHFVGQLQTNKVKSVISYASTIHSVDRPSLVGELAKQLAKTEKILDVFIELNLTDDLGRGGVDEANLAALTEQVMGVKQLNLLGVMAVAGLAKNPRTEFERALRLADQLRKIAPQARGVSMGMSEDYQVAIEMGATHIRVGSAITGPRPNNA